MRPLLAHQGGWDEVVLFAVPIIAALFLVRWAERRSRRNRENQESHSRDGGAD